MVDAPPETNDPHASSDVRKLRLSFTIGAVLGAILGTTRYGFFTMQNVAMVGLGIIVAVSCHAAWVGIRPSRP